MQISFSCLWAIRDIQRRKTYLDRGRGKLSIAYRVSFTSVSLHLQVIIYRINLLRHRRTNTNRFLPEGHGRCACRNRAWWLKGTRTMARDISEMIILNPATENLPPPPPPTLCQDDKDSESDKSKGHVCWLMATLWDVNVSFSLS